MPDFSDPSVVQVYLDKGYGLATGAMLAVAILIAGWMVAKWAQRITVRSASKLDQAVAGFLGNMARYAVIAASVIAALESVGVETTSFVAILGAAGLAVGLALQGSLSNFAAGVMILIFRPFQLQDFCEAGGKTGTITDIGLFATTMLTPSNETIIMPNSAITGGVITNYTRQGTRRGSIDVGVAYGEDLKKVEAACRKAAATVPTVLEEPGVGFAFTEMAASSLNFKLHVWCQAADFLPTLHAVRSAVYNELNAQDIEIPFNQIVVHQADDAS